MATATKDAATRNQEYQNLDWGQRLEAYRGDKEAAQIELGRSKNVFMDNPNDAAKQQGANDWANKVREYSGIDVNDPTYGNGVNSASRVTTSGTEQNKATLENPIQNGSGMANYLNQNKPVAQQYNATFTPGKTYDLSAMFGAINGSKPGQSQFSMENLKAAMDAMNAKGTASRQFNLTDLQKSIDNAKTAGGTAPTVNPEKFQTPEAIAQYIQQMKTQLQPLTDQQKSAATSGFNSTMQKNRDAWASRGMLASGAAAAQEQEGAVGLSNNLAGIEAQAQANAVPLAFQSANLGLNEASQRFGQQDTNRKFDAGQAQQNVANLISGMGAEGAQRSQDQAASQQNVANTFNALGLQDNQQQNFLRNLMSANQMDMGQNQWSQQFGAQQQQADYGRWLGTQQLNQNADNNWQNQLSQALGMQEQSRQFDTTTANQQKQQNINNATNLSQMLGKFIQPMSGGKELFDQVAGQNTLQGNQNQISNATSLSQLLGQFIGPNADPQGLFQNLIGQNTLGQKQFDLNQYKSDESTKEGKATNGYLSNTLSFGTKEDALNYIVQNGDSIANDGGDISKILSAIEHKYPKSASGQSGIDPLTINKLANSMALKDPNWSEAADDDTQQKIIQKYKDRLLDGVQTGGTSGN